MFKRLGWFFAGCGWCEEGDLEEKRQRSKRITVQVAKELCVCMCVFDLLFSFSKSSTHRMFGKNFQGDREMADALHSMWGRHL